MDQYAALGRYFGYTAFRPGQEQLVDGILSGRDVLGIMPTGGGKSLCYQIPALLLPGLTLVISPLISLMRDQVEALTAMGIRAAFLNSSQSLAQGQEVLRAVRGGACRLLYVAPERLENPWFAEQMARLPLSLVAVDEAHCISQWGQDFRPSYLRITKFVEALPRRPVLAAFTATATAQVQEDIVERLALRAPVRVVTGFDRPNLFFDVLQPKDKRAALLSLLGQRPGKSGIVYCATRGAVEEVCAFLGAQGIPAVRYHAGLEEAERRQSQDDFQFDRKPVMVATNAFGMGIDKSNVSFVIHYNMPKNLESYYQEAGRAGRDGEPADCILLYAPKDEITAKYLINHSADAVDEREQEALRRRDKKRLEVMVDYCKTKDCFRGRILDYFTQSHAPACGNCGNCRGSFRQTDITVQAQMLLSCIQRVRSKLGYYVGAALILRVLRGSRDKRVLELGLDQLSTYGLLRGNTRGQLRDILDCLLAQGYVVVEEKHETLRFTEAAREVLFQGKRVMMQTRTDAAQKAPPARRREISAGPADEGLLEALRAERTRLAKWEGVPAYVVFSNATLADMARKAPESMEEFLEVSGVGAVKAQRYGEAFLKVLQTYKDGSA